MAANREIVNFVELRQAIVGMQEFSEAALRFMERNGIGLGGPRVTRKPKPRVNGASLVARVKRQYIQDASVLHAAAKRGRTPKLSGAAKIRHQRETSAALLAQLDTVEPRPVDATIGSRFLGPLVRRGYIKRKGDGYIRTTKEFHVTPTADSNGHSDTPAPNEALTVAQAAKRLKMTDSNVRLLIKAKKLYGETALRPRKGMKKAAPMIVIQPDEVARYLAQQM